MKLLSTTLFGVFVSAGATHGAAVASTTSGVGQASLTTSPSASTASIEPCALASKASASARAAQPSGSVAIPAEIAYNCLESIPNYEKPALELLASLLPLWLFQSTLPYLQDPPPGFLYPPVNILQGLEDIAEKVSLGLYDSEYDFQVDIAALSLSARDGHMYYYGDATGLFTFQRAVALVSISVDGLQLPQVYVQEDLLMLESNGNGDILAVLPTNKSYTPSPVTAIDGIDVVTFLTAQSFIDNHQDPDACYNDDFFQLAQITFNPGDSNFLAPIFYPGPLTTFTFANGTSKPFPNTAVVEKNLKGINSGSDMYSAFLIPPTSTANSSAAATSTAEATTASATSAPAASATYMPMPGYPYPIVAQKSNLVSGYFLNDTGYEDTAVLVLPTFQATGEAAKEFQTTVQTFLASAHKAGKTKLIVDLQANGGGTVDLGWDTFAQIFPSKSPNTQGNEAAQVGLDVIGKTSSNFEAAAQNQTARNENEVRPFTVQGLMTLNHSSFSSWPTYFGPVEMHGGNFTNLFQDNWTNPAVASTVVITGTNNRTGFQQLFEAENIVMLYDGYCASTCAVFSELMKTLGGVHSIAVGGRPQFGPMQGVGGVKGSNDLPFSELIPVWEAVVELANRSVLAEAVNTPFANISNLTVQRSNPLYNEPGSINIRNNFRIGDTSLTPLQFVYEAADCRIWYTQDMLFKMDSLWKQVADISFPSNETAFSSRYCVSGSAGQPTSLSGGLQNGTLGPQTPPATAKSNVNGWLINGTVIQNFTGGSPAMIHQNGSMGNPSSTASGMPAQVTTNGAVQGSVWFAMFGPAIAAAAIGLAVL